MRASLCRRSRFVKPCKACSPSRSTSKSMRSLRDSGLNAVTVLPSFAVALVVSIEISHCQGRVLYLAQGFQIPGVALRRDLAISEQQRHALAQGYPRHHIPAFPAYPLANPKLLRIVDHRLHPQYRRSDGSRTVAGCRVTVAPGYSLLLHLARGRGLGLWDLTFAPLRQDWQSDALEGNP